MDKQHTPSTTSSATSSLVETENDEQPLELKATEDMCKLCFDVLIDKLLSQHGLSQDPVNNLLESHLPPHTKCPLFVTWEMQQHHPSDYHLRGCIGTLSPRTLRSSLGEYALTSALKDHRFNPISLQEVKYLRVAVSLLVNYEECANYKDWTVGLHGIIIKFHDGDSFRSGKYFLFTLSP